MQTIVETISGDLAIKAIPGPQTGTAIKDIITAGPQGPPGPPGPQGPAGVGGGSGGGGMTYLGTWAPGDYSAQAVVRHNGHTFVATTDTSATPTLPQGTDYRNDFVVMPIGAEGRWAFGSGSMGLDNAETLTVVGGQTTPDPTITTALRLYGIGHSGGGEVAVDLTLTFAQAGTISFYDRPDMENNWDKGFFYIDGTQMHSTTGQRGSAWTGRDYGVAAGTHTFRWRFQGDGGVNDSAFEDAYYVAKLRTTGSTYTTAPPYDWDAIGKYT